jgi:hypothetical protein
MFQTVGSYMPPPPPELKPPVTWGTEEHLQTLFAASGAELAFERHMVVYEHESPAAWFEYNERVLGPTIMAKAALEPQGRWEELRAELIGLYENANEADDGTMRVRAEYLLTVVQLPA